MFGHATARRVVEEMLQTLEELALPLRLMLSLDMDGQMLTSPFSASLTPSKLKKDSKSRWVAQPVV